jgi:hypothetical protein
MTPAKWSAHREQLAAGRIVKIRIHHDSSPLSFAEVMRRWQTDADFRSYFIALLAEAPFSAYRWETPPIAAATVDRPFESVLLDDPGLARTPDRAAFAAHFNSAAVTESIVSFANLGKDAILVVPCPSGPLSAYGHLAAFLRAAPERQQHALWEHVGTVMQRRLGPAPVWLSTAGAGVAWLHVRLDDRPKYYGYGPYRAFT